MDAIDKTAEGDENESQRREILRMFGLTEEMVENYLPEDQAPPVDWDRLRALVRRELPTDEAMRVVEMTAAFRSWSEALGLTLHGATPEEPQSGDRPTEGGSGEDERTRA